MSRATGPQNLEARAEVFKALSHPVRLLILNLARIRPRHGEELAAILGLNQATISHHLSKLAQAGLVESEKSQYYQIYSVARGAFAKRLAEITFFPEPGLALWVKEDAYKAKVLRTFFRQGRLIRIPAQLKKRQIVLRRLVEEFERGRAYSEREVNQILVEFHDDVATLRREFIGQRLMHRERGSYRRLD
ncbi:MAG TPA: metalloregulator ArsR/SmtB family transcription factor [bacterium]|nr:metalloregulator ArsR/SmtB family transcription factor [bacterium]